ncbi:MAG: nucleoside triphosphate pyrophosphohydrolase, partial [Desulfatitalea sp.]|nr:nucleoside triphosphate pyrophosphohydrolase [Desulfatitalea sp.]NNJ99736.1 nucleoside triphosphate pyrophosphohydrolase [Desulfatitalea sp.]
TAAIAEEMGDVLFQVLFLMHLFHEADRFAPTDVLERNLAKMIRRHPHVFGADQVPDAGQVKQRWREIKQQEKGDHNNESLMDTVPSGLPALLRAYRISERAVGAGFDWDDVGQVVAQAESEWVEFKDELNRIADTGESAKRRAEEELGDVLFTLVNVARKAGLHPERALAASTRKFIRRFKQMEHMAADRGNRLEDVPRADMEAYWQAAKKTE